jgi:23S rRNA (guanine745-N1)-methyltransferase
VGCAAGHRFDIARQGYVTLVPGAAGDSAEMVAARMAFLGAGHFDDLADALASACAGNGLVVDVGAGPGFYLSRVAGERPGLALDSSRYALRRAAKAGPRIGAVGCDAWKPLPVRDGVADAVLSVFAPRDLDELRRIGGRVVIASPTPRHLRELVEPLGLLRVGDDKPAGDAVWEQELVLSHADVEALVRMGPSAWHVDNVTARARIAALPEPVRVTASVGIAVE